MGEQTERTTGQTRDTGFQIGVRRTLPIQHEEAWDLITSKKGARIWLGGASDVKFEQGAKYHLKDGTSGEVRVFNQNSHLRLTWNLNGWKRPSTIQVRVIPKGERTVIAFHQEHLPGAKERETRRAHYISALDELQRIVGSK